MPERDEGGKAYELWHRVDTSEQPPGAYEWMVWSVGSMVTEGAFWFESEVEARKWMQEQERKVHA